MSALHPAAVLSLWASTAVFFQLLTPPGLLWGALLAVTGALLWAPKRFVLLARRIRILVVMTVVLFAMATPGVKLMPTWTWFGATWDGLWLGVHHASRLMIMVALVAWLLARMKTEQLVCALSSVFSIFAPLGVPVQRIAVRLMLVLRAMDAPSTGWRAWLLEAEAQAGVGQVQVPSQSMRWFDVIVATLPLAGLMLWVML